MQALAQAATSGADHAAAVRQTLARLSTSEVEASSAPRHRSAPLLLPTGGPAAAPAAPLRQPPIAGPAGSPDGPVPAELPVAEALRAEKLRLKEELAALGRSLVSPR